MTPRAIDMAKLYVPAIFEHISSSFHQDVLEVYPSLEEALIDYLSWVSPSDLRVLRAFLDELLSGSYSIRDLSNIWDKAGSDWYFSDGMIRHFLDLMRVQIDVRLAT